MIYNKIYYLIKTFAVKSSIYTTTDNYYNFVAYIHFFMSLIKKPYKSITYNEFYYLIKTFAVKSSIYTTTDNYYNFVAYIHFL